jgi:outer membrane cobalamin receptor
MRDKLFTLVILLSLACCSVYAQDSSKEAVEFSDFSLDKLLNIHVVSATGYSQTTAEAPSTITVITARQIADRGYDQLEDALRDVPGIDMVHVNGYAPTLFYFRGMYGAQNLRALFMIDGIAENNITGSNDMAGPAYNLHNIERIEIIWGPASALYGANAVGGIINIITKKGSELNGFHANAERGSFNTSAVNVSLGEKKNKYEYSMAGSLYNTDGPVFSNRDPQYANSFVDRAYSFNGTLSYYINKSKITAGYREYRTPMGWGTYLNSPNYYLGLPNQGYNNGDTTGILSRNFFDGSRPGVNDVYLRTAFIQEEYKATNRLNFLGRLIYRETGTADDSYAYIAIDTTFTVGTTVIPAGRELIRANIANYSNRFAGDLSTNYSLSDKHRFTLGVDFYRDNVEQGNRRSTFDSVVYVFNGRDSVINYKSIFIARRFDIRYNIGGFFQYILNTNLFCKTSFTFGARDDYNSYFGNTFSPRIVAVNQLTDKLTVKLQYGRAFRAPTNLEIHQTPASIALSTEKINTFEADGIYLPSDKIRVQLNLFHNYLTDIIVVNNQVGLTTTRNLGRITVDGLEGTVDISLSRYFSGFANITWQDTKGENIVTGSVRSVAGIAKIKGNAGITLHFQDNPFTISISGNYVGDRPLPRGDRYGPSVGGYFLSNCAFNTGKLLGTGITAGFTIHNIFNVQWLDPGFLTADGNLYPTVLEQPGRSFLLKLNLDL